MIKASTVFISYLSASAYDKTNEAGNKTIGAQAVLSAFKEMGFPEHYYKQLKKEYNEKVNPETSKKATKSNAEEAEEQQEGETAMDVDQTEQEGEEHGAGEESIAVGDETLAAADAAGGEENDEEVEEEENEDD